MNASEVVKEINRLEKERQDLARAVEVLEMVDNPEHPNHKINLEVGSTYTTYAITDLFPDLARTIFDTTLARFKKDLNEKTKLLENLAEKLEGK